MLTEENMNQKFVLFTSKTYVFERTQAPLIRKTYILSRKPLFSVSADKKYEIFWLPKDLFRKKWSKAELERAASDTFSRSVTSRM